MKAKLIDELARRLTGALPPGVNVLKEDVEKNMRSVLHAAFSKMDLVTREEFEVQAQVLQRSREKLEALEKWASDEFRSTNGQIEWILDQVLKKEGRWKK